MGKQLFKNEDAMTIRDNLEALAVETEEMTITRSLTPEERTKLQQNLSSIAIKRSILEDALDKIKQEYKNELDPLKIEFGITVKSLRTGVLEVEGTVYQIPNHEEGMMGYYDSYGNLINSRPLMPEEKAPISIGVGGRFEKTING